MVPSIQRPYLLGECRDVRICSSESQEATEILLRKWAILPDGVLAHDSMMMKVPFLGILPPPPRRKSNVLVCLI